MATISGHNTGHAIGIEVHEAAFFTAGYHDATAVHVTDRGAGIYLPVARGRASKMLCWSLPQGAEVPYAMQ